MKKKKKMGCNFKIGAKSLPWPSYFPADTFWSFGFPKLQFSYKTLSSYFQSLVWERKESLETDGRDKVSIDINFYHKTIVIDINWFHLIGVPLRCFFPLILPDQAWESILILVWICVFLKSFRVFFIGLLVYLHHW
jgi:hypothetical protein